MPFIWTEYLDLAKSLRKRNSGQFEEAAHRSAVSRAYYAAFCFARNYARDKENFRPAYGTDDHTLVIKHFETKRVSLSFQLDQLRRWRNCCDYDDEVRFLPLLLNQAIEYSDEIIKELI